MGVLQEGPITGPGVRHVVHLLEISALKVLAKKKVKVLPISCISLLVRGSVTCQHASSRIHEPRRGLGEH